jgi:hypothetical protein
MAFAVILLGEKILYDFTMPNCKNHVSVKKEVVKKW